MDQKPRVVLLEGVNQSAMELFVSRGWTVEERPKWQPDLLTSGPQILGLRSRTHLDASMLNKMGELWALGAFCIGVDQIDLEESRVLGIPVFNAPYSNTRSVAEMVLAEIIVLARQLFTRSQALHRGEWVKSTGASTEVRGKTLGLIGYGHIGSQLSVLAEAIGLRVLFFDIQQKLPMGNARSCSGLKELLVSSDFVSLHVPDTPETRQMMGEEELSWMRPGSFLINASRGTVIEEGALVAALKTEHLAGAALDVFALEPSEAKDRFQSPLCGLSNVILTPHIGGSTQEAQTAIGQEVASSLIRFVETGSTQGSVNLPSLELPRQTQATRILCFHRNEPGVLGEINSMVSASGANIVGQALATDNQTGYLIMDLVGLDDGHRLRLVREISQSSRSLRTRFLLPEKN